MLDAAPTPPGSDGHGHPAADAAGSPSPGVPPVRRRPPWRTVYVVTIVYGTLTLLALWLFTRAYRY